MVQMLLSVQVESVVAFHPPDRRMMHFNVLHRQDLFKTDTPRPRRYNNPCNPNKHALSSLRFIYPDFFFLFFQIFIHPMSLFADLGKQSDKQSAPPSIFHCHLQNQ